MLIAPILLILLILFTAIILHLIFKKKMQYWIISDMKRGVIRRFSSKPEGTIHVMFCFVDHFEPGNGGADLEQQIRRVDSWVDRYPRLADKHLDSDGICPQHTFFFPPHYDTHDHLERIVGLCSKGYGEVEMHLHHDRMEPFPDDRQILKRKILDCIESYSRCGVFCLPDGKKAYGFIHGDWALGNSLKSEDHCGVNDELLILRETGCYADFTFPVCNEAQPKLANTMFYARTNCPVPKAFNRRPIPVQSGKLPTKDCLMLVQGVIGLRWKSRIHQFFPSIEQSNIDVSDHPFKSRIVFWIDKRIHVPGKKNWIFVKIHTHGAREQDCEILLGKACDNMFSYLEANYNDGIRYMLHYTSAREMYNIIKAAEAGKDGNPNLYRDHVIPRYKYLPKMKRKTSSS